MAKKMGIAKSDMLSRDNENVAVKMALAETIIINDTKNWMKEEGIDIDELQKIQRG